MIAILGPTNTGKTGLAVKLAQNYPIEIISCDSRQIYKHFDVGTGKLPVGTAFEIQKHDKYWIINGTKVWGYDIADPLQTFSANDFGEFARLAITKINNENKVPIIVGGTGFYYEAIKGNLDTEVAPNPLLRQKLKSQPVEEILNLFPDSIKHQLNSSEQKNKQRLIRRFEVYEQTKKIFIPNKPHKNNDTIIVLTLNRETLYLKIDLWLETIWPDLINEVQQLIGLGYKNTIPMKSIIYSSVTKMLETDQDPAQVKQEIKFDLHAYIRRQETWFRRYKSAHIIDISDTNSYNQVEYIVKNNLNV